MRLRRLSCIACLTLLAFPAGLFAQSQISSNEEERLENLARSESEWTGPKNSVTVGFKVLSNGGKVQFGNLGIVPSNVTIAPASDGAVQRAYNNGFVDVDAARAAEIGPLGNQTSTQGGRYQLYVTSTADGVTTQTLTGDFLSYTPGMSRVWSYGSDAQANVRPGYIAMSSYSATSDGEFREKKAGMTAGVELQFAHEMGKLSKRVQWSLVAGITLNGINNKTAGDVHSTLHTYTDFYSLNGLAAPPTTPELPYTGPSYTDLVDPSGGIVTTGGLENTVPVGAVPADTTQQTVVGAATVHGRWQVKGAYFMMRLGPSVRTQLTERFGISASLGLAGAYAGSHYTAAESIDIPDVGNTISITEENDTTKFLTGYYADVNLEWAANERTGLFGGISAQKFGDYGQELGGRTARVDLGTSVGLRGGVSIKF